MVRLIYNLLFSVFFLFSAPFYFWKMWRRGGWQAGFAQRFGFYDRGVVARLRSGKPLVWMHAVSVGEVNVCVPLQRELRKKFPDHSWLVSTTTSTGMAELNHQLDADVLRIYYPIDFAPLVRRVLRLIGPSMIILVEAEIWPNLLWQAESRSIPVSLVNARLSDSSYRGYRRTGFLFRRIFGSLNSVGAQAEEDIARWVELGCRRECVSLTGNIKFDILPEGAPGRVDAKSVVRGLGIATDAKIIVGGSTHAGEERILAEVFQALKVHDQRLFLIVVPRHMERGAAVAKEIASLGLRVRRRSAIGGQSSDPTRPVDCLVVDTTGELMDFYAIADVVFVGKSLTARGGQNPLEPAKFGKPLIFGKKMGNFRAIVRQLLLERAAIMVENPAELEIELAKILNNSDSAGVLAGNARRVMAKNTGSLMRTCELLDERRKKKLTKGLDEGGLIS